MILKMKYNALNRFWFWTALMLLPMLAGAKSAGNLLFVKGNSLYAKGQFKQALEVYRQLTEQGYSSAALYFNMGNASYKNNDIASAVLYLEKAHKLAPGDDDINYNLKYVNLKTTDKITAVPEFFLTQWWHEFILSFSTSVFAFWSVVLMLAGSTALILYFFAGSVSVKKASFYASVVLFFLGILALFAASRQQSYFDDTREAVVFSDVVNVKSAPADKSAVLFVIHSGTKVETLDTDNDWIKIGLANGNEGWIRNSDVKTI